MQNTCKYMQNTYESRTQGGQNPIALSGGNTYTYKQNTCKHMQNTSKIHANTNSRRLSGLPPFDSCVSACIMHVFALNCMYWRCIWLFNTDHNPDFFQISGVNGFALICMYHPVLVCMVIYLFVFDIKHSLSDDRTATGRPSPMS